MPKSALCNDPPKQIGVYEDEGIRLRQFWDTVIAEQERIAELKRKQKPKSAGRFRIVCPMRGQHPPDHIDENAGAFAAPAQVRLDLLCSENGVRNAVAVRDDCLLGKMLHYTIYAASTRQGNWTLIVVLAMSVLELQTDPLPGGRIP